MGRGCINDIKQFIDMSKIKETIELKPNHGCTRGARDEELISRGHECPECNGNGYHWVDDPDPAAHGCVKEPCSICNGSGKVAAFVTVHWQASEGRSKV